MGEVPTIPSRESAATKARRLLGEARLIVRECRPGYVDAICRGEGAVYHLGYAHGGWHCTCPSMGNRCSHLLALKSVTAPDLG